ncbi:MAG: AMP-binding protein [Pseudonocardia sp.]
MGEFTLFGVVEATAAAVPGRAAVVHRGGTLTYARLVERARRLARLLGDRGLGIRRERAGLAGHECGQDMLAQYLHNGPEYVEGMLGAYRARVAPFNVNYRYVAGELRYLLRDAAPRAVQFHGRFAAALAEVLPDVPSVRLLLQVDDGSGADLLPGAVDYEAAIAAVAPEPQPQPSPDDLYVLYTGGTTGLPKGVLWRQGDAAVSLFGARDRRRGTEWACLADKVAAIATHPQRYLLLAPLMHGGGQIAALHALSDGHTIVLPDDTTRFDPAGALDAVARHGATALVVVGDAFGRPLADELAARPRELPTLRLVVSGGAALSAVHRQRLVAAVPGLTVLDSIGASETGVQGRSDAPAGDAAPTYVPEPGTVVLADDRATPLPPGHDGTGWLATAGRVPLGYLGDPAKTAVTFPVIGGRRLAVPGDRARLLADGRIQLLGRDSTTINTGGEKVFAEEVEAALRCHPDVVDAVVCGRPSARWGEEVVALVAVRPGRELDEPGLRAHCARRLAGYKLPKAVIVVDEVRRSPSGKPDVRWARAAARDGM